MCLLIWKWLQMYHKLTDWCLCFHSNPIIKDEFVLIAPVCWMNQKALMRLSVSLFFWKSRCRSCIRRLGWGPEDRRASVHSVGKTKRKSQKQWRPKTRTTADVLKTLAVLPENKRGHVAQRVPEHPGAAHKQPPVGDGVTLLGAAVRVSAAASRDSAGVRARVAADSEGDGASSQRLHRRSHSPHAR